MLIPAILFSLSAVMMAVALVRVSPALCLHPKTPSSHISRPEQPSLELQAVTWDLTGSGEDSWALLRCAPLGSRGKQAHATVMPQGGHHGPREAGVELGCPEGCGDARGDGASAAQ